MSARLTTTSPRTAAPLAVGLWLGFGLLWAGCFNPSYREGIECGPGESCPDGWTCGPDNVCRAASEQPIDAGDEATDGDAPRDAQPDGVDAAPTICVDNSDCADPPSPCLVAGACNPDTRTCEYPVVDCSELDGSCVRGVCRPSDGACVTEPRDDGLICAEPTIECGDCLFPSACAEEATQTCVHRSFACESGECVATDDEEVDICDARETEGQSCGPTIGPRDCSPDGCPDCIRTCICDEQRCVGGACTLQATQCEDCCTGNCQQFCLPEFHDEPAAIQSVLPAWR